MVEDGTRQVQKVEVYISEDFVKFHMYELQHSFIAFVAVLDIRR